MESHYILQKTKSIFLFSCLTVCMMLSLNMQAAIVEVDPPLAVCQDITVQLDASGMATIIPTQLDGGSTDDVGIDFFSVDLDTFTCADVGVVSVILTVTDVEGFTDTCTAMVTVEDVLPSTLDCPSNFILTGDPLECSAIANFPIPSLSGDCGEIITPFEMAYNYTGAIETFTVPANVYSLTIEVYGAEGGGPVKSSSMNPFNAFPGKGAQMIGDVQVTPGDELQILVGEKGKTNSQSSTGGGGSFVVGPNGPLVIAAGGAGAWTEGGTDPVFSDGEGGRITTNGGGSNFVNGVAYAGGDNGNGGGNQGPNPIFGAGSGGGYLTDGASTGSGNGGSSFLNGGTGGDAGDAGGNDGGFGGGGSHTNNGCCSAGGGGGYSGGLGGGRIGFSGILVAGGGGSINIGANQDNVPDIHSGDGQIVIKYTTTSQPVTQTGGLPPGSLFPIGTTTNTFEVTDSTGAVLTCSFDVTVLNGASISFSCPSFQIEDLDENCEFILPDYTPLANVSSGCGLEPILTQVPAPGTLITTSNFQTIELFAQFENETLSCSFTMQARDNTPPEVTFCPSNIVVNNDPGQCGAVVNFPEPIGIDNCGSVNVFLISGFDSGDTFPVGETEVRYIIQDDFGNDVFCEFTVTVNDIEAPVINCAPFTVTLDETGLYTLDQEDAFPEINYTIDQSGAFAPIDISTTGTIINVGTFDSNQGAFPIGFTFNFYGNDYTEFYAASNGFITFNDNESDGCCNGQSLPANIDNLIAYFWTLLDPDEGGQIRYQTIGSAPNRTLVLSADAISMFAALGGNNNGITITSQVHLKEGSNVIEIHSTSVETFFRSATMGIQNADGSMVQTVPGRNGELWSASNDFVSFTPPDPSLPSATDNCEADIVTFSPAFLSCNNIGDNEVIITVTDPSGNETSCTTTVTVEPFCPEDISVDNDPGMCGAIVNYPDISSGCPATIIQTAGLPSGSMFPIGETINTFVITSIDGPPPFTNDSDNVTECSFTVTVTDTEVPTITCPLDITVERDPGECTAIVNYETPVGVDSNCPNPVTVQIAGLASGETFPTGTTVNVFEVTDENGNVATCSFEVTVNDSVGPTIMCEGDIEVDNDPGVCGALITYTMPVAMDDCEVASVTQIEGLPSGSLFPVGVTINEFEVEDTFGNTATCSFTVTINDIEAPQITCGDPISVTLDVNGQYVLEGDDFFPTPSYNLDQSGTFAPIDISTTGQSFNLDDDDFETGLDIGFSFTFFGNVYTTFNVSSNGFISFDFDDDDGCCEGESLPTNNIENFIAFSWTDLDPSESGIFRYETIGTAPNRTLVFSAENIANFDDNDLKTNAQVHLKEGSNNIEIHTLSTEIGGDEATMGIQDVNGEAFVVVPGREASIWSISNDYVSFTPQVLSAMLSDNCGIDTITFSPDVLDCTMGSDQEVIITVIDAAGNMNSCTTSVNIETAVYANCSSGTFTLDPMTGSVTITPEDINNGSGSSCGNPFTLSIDKDTFTCEQAGLNIVTLTITDDVTGLTDTCEAEVFIEGANTSIWNGISWSNGTPDSTTIAINNAFLEVTPETSFEACACVNNSNIIVDAGAYIKVVGNISNNGFIDVRHQGSIVQVSDDARVISVNSGGNLVRVTTPFLKPKDFIVTGSPTAAASTNEEYDNGYTFIDFVTSAFIPNQDVENEFPDAVNFMSENLDWTAPYSGDVNPGEGYLYRPQDDPNEGDQTYDLFFFGGPLNSGVISYDIEYNGTQNASPNILANPYPSAIDADAFLMANSSLFDALYFWEHLTSPDENFPGPYAANFTMEDISIYTLAGGTGTSAAENGGDVPSKYISTSQGFGVKALTSGTAVFNNAMRVTGNNNTLRSPENKNRIWLAIDNETYGFRSTSMVAFLPETTQDYDQLYEAKRIAKVVSLFSHLPDGSESLAIQAREPFYEDIQIPFGFSSIIQEASTYTISLANVEGDIMPWQTPYLVDHLTNVTTNLLESTYVFDADPGTFENRFTLQFKEEVLGIDTVALPRINLYPNPTDGRITINSPLVAITGIEVKDMLGRTIFTQQGMSNNEVVLDITNQASAVYFVLIHTDQGTLTKRVIRE